MPDQKIYARIDYEDKYVQPLLLEALEARLPPEILVLINDTSVLPSPKSNLLQWRQYESIDLDFLSTHAETSLANSFIIRKALIRKHYLSATVSHWLTKNPDSVLNSHVKPSVEFEVDFAEFLDDALIEAYELKESWARNEGKQPPERQWWILKPGMSDRGQGIRLFSLEEELTEIFTEWDPPSDDEDDDDAAEHSGDEAVAKAERDEEDDSGNGVITSQLRHFVAQPYIDPPLLMPPSHPSADRKFHIRTYVLAVGALKVYVYKPMLALFAGQPYQAPGTSSTDANENLSAHLTNTCLQTGEREGSVHAFWSLPSTLPSLTSVSSGDDWRESAFKQICTTTGQIFEAAARSMSIHFQPLPNAFEIYGLDFMVDASGTVWLLEVNAFPDFAQTGDELQGLVKGLFESVVDVGIKPFFGLGEARNAGAEDMVEVLDIDLGRR